MPSGGGGGGSLGSSGPRYDPATEYAKAVTAMKASQYRDAARAAEHVTEAVPQNPDAWRLLGAAKAGDNDWRGARRAYEKAVKLAPDDLSGHAGLGLALANLKDAKAAGELDWLKAKAQSCGDACPDAARLKAMTSMVSDALAGGAAAPKPSASLSGGMLFGGPMAGEGAYVQAVSLINQKRYDEALTSLSAAEAKFGEHPDILTYQGYTWRKKGDYARAERFYKAALALNPAHVGATEYYGELKVAEGDMAGAKKLLARLDRLCAFDCAGAEELRRWIAAGHDPQQ
jgi:Flp pilus assembly protein TadD